MALKTKKESLVWEVCDELYAKRENPTIKSVGDLLEEYGHKRGSNRDLAMYMRSWRTSNLPSEENDNTQVFSDPLNKALATLREELHKEAKEEIAKIEVLAREQVTTAQNELNQITEKNIGLKQSVAATMQELIQYKQALNEKEQIIIQTQLEITKLVEHSKVKEEQFHLIEKKITEELSNNQKNFNSLLFEFNQQHKSWQHKIEQALEQKTSSEEQVKQQEEKIKNLTDQLKNEQKSNREQHSELIKELHIEKINNTDQEKKITQLEIAYQELKQEITTTKLLKELLTYNQEIKEQITANINELKQDINKQISHATIKSQETTQELSLTISNKLKEFNTMILHTHQEDGVQKVGNKQEKD